jgi:hypothetical protein
MVDWGRILEIGIAGAPAAAFLLFAAWSLWFVRRLFRGLARLVRRAPRDVPVQDVSRKTTMRIEPVLEPVAPASPVDARELAAAVQALMHRVEVLEQRLVTLSESRMSGKTALRIVRNEEVEPV